MADYASGQEAQAKQPALPKSLGGDISPLRSITDPYPTFNGMALDARNNRVLFSDENRKGLLLYERIAGSKSSAVTRTMRQVLGPATGIGFIPGVQMDPARREVYAVNSDS